MLPYLLSGPSACVSLALAYFAWHLYGQQPSTVCGRDQGLNLPDSKHTTLAQEEQARKQNFNNWFGSRLDSLPERLQMDVLPNLELSVLAVSEHSVLDCCQFVKVFSTLCSNSESNSAHFEHWLGLVLGLCRQLWLHCPVFSSTLCCLKEEKN